MENNFYCLEYLRRNDEIGNKAFWDSWVGFTCIWGCSKLYVGCCCARLIGYWCSYLTVGINIWWVRGNFTKAWGGGIKSADFCSWIRVTEFWCSITRVWVCVEVTAFSCTMDDFLGHISVDISVPASILEPGWSYRAEFTDFFIVCGGEDFSFEYGAF